MSSFCPKCGAGVADDARFCAACGTTIERDPPEYEWYYMVNSYKRGPMKQGGDGMISAIRNAEITEDTKVWREGLPEWMPAGKTEMGTYIQQYTPFLPQSTLSDRWLWALAIVPWVLDFILAIMAGVLVAGMTQGQISSDSFLASILGGGTLIAFILNDLFIVLDMREVKKHGYHMSGWLWMGLILIPVYMFVRASKTTKNVAPGIVWCVLFLLSNFGLL